MEYVSFFGLHKDPFPSHHDPDLYFPAESRVECLQKIELVIRLRQGLAVLIGPPGSGKTSLVAQLIEKLYAPEGEMVSVFIPSPEFATPLELLRQLCSAFGMMDTKEETNELLLRERLKEFLFRKGINEKKNVVLLIDEGQHLPSFSLEFFRELLNYETNQYKLLQIVLIGQDRLRASLARHRNLMDRISVYSRIGAFPFRETREMIRFRLCRAGGEALMNTLFPNSTVMTVHWLTKGSPQKIVNLCSLILATLVIQNKRKASPRLALACARRRPFLFSRKQTLQWLVAGLAAAFIITGLLMSFLARHPFFFL